MSRIQNIYLTAISSYQRILLLLSLIFLTSSAPNAALACGGGLPSFPPWTLDHVEYRDEYPLPGGQNELPILSPGNDTRTNLQLLMMTYSPWTVAPINPLKLDRYSEYNEQLSKSEYKSILYLFEPSLFTLIELGDDLCKSPKDHNIRINPFYSSDETAQPIEGSRCNSNTTGAAKFIASIKSSVDLSASEKELLIKSRNDLNIKCDTSTSPDPSLENALKSLKNSSQAFTDFGNYLIGAKAFYDGNYDYSIEQFSKLNASNTPWLEETSIYMIARALINKSQRDSFKDLDGSPKPNNIHIMDLINAEQAINRYLLLYPNGVYTQSASGLLRRVSWLYGNKERLSEQYAKSLHTIGDPGVVINSAELADEIDRKLLSDDMSNIKEPALIAIEFLKRMRSNSENRSTLTDMDLTSKEKYFENDRNLFYFLRAARFYYVDKNYLSSEINLKQINRQDNPNGYITFSSDVLAGQLLMASKKYELAERHWTSILPKLAMPWQKQAVELGLAITWEKLGKIHKVFETAEGINSPKIRSILIRYVASPPLLHQVLANSEFSKDEKALAAFTLLYKDATRNRYNDYLVDISGIKLAGEIRTPSGDVNLDAFNWQGSKGPYDCPALHATIDELSKSPRSSHGLICLAEFIRVQQLDEFEGVSPKPNELGGTKDNFSGTPFTRSGIYEKLINRTDIPPSDNAYALYRAIYCYSPTGINGCGGKDVPMHQRKSWFHQLKSKYGSSPWSQELKYYW
jgi:hypothetical protein